MQRRLLVLITAMSVLLLAEGCNLGSPVAPQAPGRDQTAPAIQILDQTGDLWNVVATKLVLPGLLTQVRGSRYTLTFQPLSLLSTLLVTIRERDPGIVDVDLGPDGSVFRLPVTLQVSYCGTIYDPSQPNYAGHKPKLFWFNPATKTWVVVPGTDDPKHCLYTVKLQHFSRYAMGDGTSGWEDGQDDHGKEFVK